jgi:tetratricopeptide (TPR) repeat protein
VNNRKFTKLFALLFFVSSIGTGLAQEGYQPLLDAANKELQAGQNEEALAASQRAIKLDKSRWEAYAVAGGALMNLKRYPEAEDDLSKAVELAPDSKKPPLRDLRRQCVLAESGVTPSPNPPPAAAASTSQAEIVLWKSIENSSSSDDFKAYLAQYPNGAFASLAKSHIDRIAEQQTASAKAAEDAKRKSSQEAEYKRYHIPVVHQHDMSWCWGYLDITPDGVEYNGSEHHVKIERIDVTVIKAQCSNFCGLKFIMKTGPNYAFIPVNDYAVENQTLKGKQATAYKPYVIGDPIKEKWGWVASKNNRELVPGQTPALSLNTENESPNPPRLNSTASLQADVKVIVGEQSALAEGGGAPPSFAILHVIRNSSTGGGVHPYILIDQQRTIEIVNKQSVRMLVPPGTHTISVGDADVSTSEVPNLVMEPGKEYWVKLSLSIGGWKVHSKLVLEPNESARTESAKLVEVNFGEAFKR